MARKSYSSREIIRLLKSHGWELVRVSGDHHQYKHPTKPGRVTLPHPKRDLPKGTLASVFRQMGIKPPR